jgi:hypothetical protein
MGIAVSYAWSIADLLLYQRKRSPLTLFLPLALFLTLAASGADEQRTIGPVAPRVLLALLWLFQFRLADDLADRERDRLDHPDRVLTRADARPFVRLLALLTFGNVLVTFWLRPWPRGAEFLALAAVFGLWYALPRGQIAGLAVLLKYPAFVYLLSDSWIGAGVLLLVYCCFAAYEILHDTRLATVRGTCVILALSLVLMTASAFALLADAEAWRIATLVPGGFLLAWLFVRHGRRREPKLWPYGVFFVACVWIACGYRV